MAKPKRNQMTLSEEVRLPRHRARKTEKQRADVGRQLMQTTQSTHCPSCKQGEQPSQCKTFGGMGKTPISPVKVVRSIYSF